jgi:hypothetical protein
VVCFFANIEIFFIFPSLSMFQNYLAFLHHVMDFLPLPQFISLLIVVLHFSSCCGLLSFFVPFFHGFCIYIFSYFVFSICPLFIHSFRYVCNSNLCQKLYILTPVLTIHTAYPIYLNCRCTTLLKKYCTTPYITSVYRTGWSLGTPI